jgi:hypothetical protein
MLEQRVDIVKLKSHTPKVPESGKDRAAQASERQSIGMSGKNPLCEGHCSFHT